MKDYNIGDVFVKGTSWGVVCQWESHSEIVISNAIMIYYMPYWKADYERPYFDS